MSRAPSISTETSQQYTKYMAEHPQTSLFLVGGDYHLGDLLWLTCVLDEYRRGRHPGRLLLGCPDRGITDILEGNPAIDVLLRGEPEAILRWARRRYGRDLVVHDLRVLPIALDMLRRWKERPPWLYYRDLWFEPRGQWLATYLRLGRLGDPRPRLNLDDRDRALAGTLSRPYVVLAPHIGQYRLPLADKLWRSLKGWPESSWVELAAELTRREYQPVTLAAAGQAPIPGTLAVVGAPIRQVAGVIERAAALISGESGLWFIAAALRVPFIIVPWWLPHSVNWPAPMRVPYRLVYRRQASVKRVTQYFHDLVESAE